jgi:hypothetical protein
MEKIKTPIFLTTLYVFIYLMVCELDRTAQWAIHALFAFTITCYLDGLSRFTRWNT